jgi:hypothetical protein
MKKKTLVVEMKVVYNFEVDEFFEENPGMFQGLDINDAGEVFDAISHELQKEKEDMDNYIVDSEIMVVEFEC